MNNFYKVIFGFLLLSAFPGISLAQRELSGFVTEKESGSPVPYVQVLNFSSQTSVYGNSKGIFTINAGKGDTLVVHAAGYLYNKVVVVDSMFALQPFRVAMDYMSLELDAARLYAIGSYDQLKQKIIDYDLPETPTEKLNNYMAEISVNEAREAYLQAMASQHSEGVTVGFAIPSPEDIERKKLAKIIEKQQVKDQVYIKYNPLMVKKITGISGDDEVIEFMAFCKFSEKYLLEVNEYDLASRIAVKYELFKKMKEEEKVEPNPMNVIEIISTTLA